MSSPEGDGEIRRLQEAVGEKDRVLADILAYQRHYHGPNIPKKNGVLHKFEIERNGRSNNRSLSH